MTRLNRVEKIPSRIISNANFRRAYSGITAVNDAVIEPVTKSELIGNSKDLFGSGLKTYGRLNDYKEEYRKYYALEQELEDTVSAFEHPEDLVDLLFLLLTQINEVIEALIGFDKAFHTCYTQDVQAYVKKFEPSLIDIGILLHVDGTLGFFKGRLKRIFQASPEKFEFLILPNEGFLPGLIDQFQLIKAVIPERINDLPLHDEATGTIIDTKL